MVQRWLRRSSLIVLVFSTLLGGIVAVQPLYASEADPAVEPHVLFDDLPEPLPAIVESLEGEAWLVSKRGVETPLTEGMQIEAAQGIRTGGDAFVALMLGDGSRVVLPSYSSVVLLSEQKIMQIKLLQGQVESYVQKRVPAAEHFQILTPTGVLGVRGTHFRARTVEGESKVFTEVLDGSVAASRENVAGEAALVNAKQGLLLVPDGKLSAVDLLPAPKLLGQQGGAAAQGGWTLLIKPVVGASRYRVQVASDPKFLRIKREQYSLATQVSFSGLDLPLYYVRISAFDEQGFEGLTSVYHVMHFMPVAGQY